MKKKMIALVGAAVFCAGLGMQQAYGQTRNEAVTEYCAFINELAASTLDQRQYATKEEMKAVSKEYVPDDKARAIVDFHIDEAFKIPLIEKGDIDFVTKHYGDYYELECLKEKSGTAL